MDNNNNNQWNLQLPRHPWRVREDTELIMLVHFIGIGDWIQISNVLGRSPSQCRRRYFNLIALGSAERFRRIFRRRVNRRFRQRLRLIPIGGMFQRIQLLAQQNTNGRRMDLNFILNTPQDPRMNINYILNVE
ncbi:hypothetical protein C1645_759466 [Glomus cerebriforme]|uniref:Myb-like domain-containing protein n=1 Tax=Glomus cerebriforme TaxID=658196 RepID=A0A397T920_9GLOM|nr:hypothetical protein C1645_759466 [Glomus cerebriforme]